MNKSMEYVIGFVVGVLIAFIVLRVLFYFVEKTKKKAGRCEYDERQELMRGRGFKYGFFTLMIYCMLYGMLEGVLDGNMIFYENEGTGYVVGVIIALMVFAVYCIWNEAYMANNETPATVYLLLGGVGLLNLIVGVANTLHGELLIDGKLTFRVINLLMGIAFLVLAGTFAVRNRIDSRQEE